ncbi:hypothetical protein AVEN_218646-1 [Araneus ventricosus]|uniref:Uncharacterized protein n=1 Tax=Araneus ventricosus TaxID=182803 RepID=A0A4Y2B6E8_ARAVE|nr:hypothetical protein AVEN_218646-1 [Araneus ventricosus]
MVSWDLEHIKIAGDSNVLSLVWHENFKSRVTVRVLCSSSDDGFKFQDDELIEDKSSGANSSDDEVIQRSFKDAMESIEKLRAPHDG